MEETPICDSVERDLDLTVDEITASVGTGPVPEPTVAATSARSSAPTSAQQSAQQSD